MAEARGGAASRARRASNAALRMSKCCKCCPCCASGSGASGGGPDDGLGDYRKILELAKFIEDTEKRMEGLSWFERQKIFWTELLPAQIELQLRSAARCGKVADLIADAELKAEVARRKTKVAERVTHFEQEVQGEVDTTMAAVSLGGLTVGGGAATKGGAGAGGGKRGPKGGGVLAQLSAEDEERIMRPFVEHFSTLLGTYHYYTMIEESEIDVQVGDIRTAEAIDCRRTARACVWLTQIATLLSRSDLRPILIGMHPGRCTI